MKKWLFPFAVVATLAACSSPESRRVADDSYSKHTDSTPTFATLDTAGLTIVGQQNHYQLPTINTNKGEAVDIRPPAKPMAIIKNSVAQFDGQRASIVYSPEKHEVYNLKQIQRLLTEKNISFTTKDGKIQTDWASTGRSDEAKDTSVRYLIEELGNKEANALVVSVLEIKRDDIVAVPNAKEKELYASDLLNKFVGELELTYRTQQQQTAVASENAVVKVQSSIITDMNNHLALAMSSNFKQSWSKLATALPELGFEIKEETVGRGHRLLKYKALNATEWARFGVTQPNLENGEYNMQLSAYGNQSAVVIYDEDKQALTGEQAQALYQALSNVLAK